MAIPSQNDDHRFMALAVEEARGAAAVGEVPVGAALVVDGEVLATRGNERERRHDPTAHAEMLVLRDAAAMVGGWRLKDATLYVTLEPCPMCAGAMVMSQLTRCVYGAADERQGCCGSVYDLPGDAALSGVTSWQAGVMAEECSQLMRDFFAGRRG